MIAERPALYRLCLGNPLPPRAETETHTEWCVSPNSSDRGEVRM
jgi:hypothetical protein